MSANRKPVNRFRPSFETLENREMMSVTSVTLSSGVLRVALNGANDDVRISEASIELPTVNIEVSRGHNILPLRTITVTDLTRPNASWTFNRQSVTSIKVNNNFTLGDTNIINSTSNLPTFVDLRNSKSTNRVVTGAGNDTVFGSAGNDFIRTNAGNDMIAAGAGDDVINGGLGSDIMMGGANQDKLVDAFGIGDTNLMYGDAGNDSISSFCKNDVVDGGTEIDTASVKTGTAIVRKIENISINDVPLGNAVTDSRLTARQAANRFLQAYGLPIITHVISLDDDTYGLTPSSMVSLIREVKPDATLSDAARNLEKILLQGKPVIAKFGGTWAVFTGYNSITKKFTFVGKDGLSHTTLGSHVSRIHIY